MDIGHRLDPTHFQHLADCVVDRRGDRGERVVGARATNCSTDDLFMAIKTIEATQAENQRSRAEKSYHLVISFREGERPPLETLRAVEDELCAAIGLADHERISAIHDDTDNLHIHVAINKVHPVTFRNVEPYYDMPKLMTACIELEAKFGLQIDNHGAHAEQRVAQTAKKMEAYSGRETLQTWIAANAMPALDEITASAGSWAEVQAGFAKFGLEVRARGAGLVIGQIGEDLW